MPPQEHSLESKPHTPTKPKTTVERREAVQSVQPQGAIQTSTAQASDPLNWSELAFELELDAISRQIVLNAIVSRYQADKLELAILTEMEVILKPEVREQIKQALERKLGVSLSLEFISQSALNVETPQQADNRKQELARQAAIEQIREDPMVKQLNTLFSAELVESSVKKTHSE